MNCFGSFEWPSIRSAYADLLPEMLPWEQWNTSQAAQAFLPSGESAMVNRGAGQGEPDGPLKAAICIGHRVREAKRDLAAAGCAPFVDLWYLDDGQIICRTRDVESILRALDIRLEQAGATRGSRSGGCDVKSTVRVFSAGAVQPDFSAYVLDTCTVVPSTARCKVLGGQIGDEAHQTTTWEGLCDKVRKVHEAVDGIGDPATEFVLKSTCASVCKATYALRLGGDMLRPDTLATFSTVMRESLGTTLGGELDPDAWALSTCSLAEGGLGFRVPEETALAAFVASRTTSRPGAFECFAQLTRAGYAEAGALEEIYDDRTTAATTKLLSLYSTQALATQAREDILASSTAAQSEWDALATPAEGGGQDESQRPDQPCDDESASQEVLGVPRAPGLQRKLCRGLDKGKVNRLVDDLSGRGRHEDVRRIQDLRDEHQDHSWIGSLNPELGPVLSPLEWVTAVRIRQGCNFLVGGRVCGACGEHILDAQATHALCCARGESTRGHNMVRDTLLEAFADAGGCRADPVTAHLETSGCADSALVVMVKCPNATGAGRDCTEQGKREKLLRYENVLHELADQGIRYAPAVFSTFGRRHPDVSAMISEAARRVARHHGVVSTKVLEQRWHRGLAVAIWRRAALMVHACLNNSELLDPDEVRGDAWGDPPARDAGTEPVSWAARVGGA